MTAASPNAPRTDNSVSVILFQIISDLFGGRLVDGRAEGTDQLGAFRVPHGGGRERRVHDDIIETVTTGAVGLHRFNTGRFLELDGFLLRKSLRCEKSRRCETNAERDQNECT